MRSARSRGEISPKVIALAFVIPLLLFATILAVLAIIAASGRAKWERTKADLLARGERLTIRDLEPPPLADSQNFFADDLWREVMDRTGPDNKEPRVKKGDRQLDIFDREIATESAARLKDGIGRALTSRRLRFALREASAAIQRSQDETIRSELARLILEELVIADPVLDRISKLLVRPRGRAPLDYSSVLTMPLDHISYMIALGQILGARATAQLVLGDPSGAADDTVKLFRLARMLEGEPVLMSLLVRGAILGIASDVIRQGLSSHQWKIDDLQKFDALLAPVDLVEELRAALRVERTWMHDTTEKWRNRPGELSTLIRGEPAGAFAEMGFRLYLHVSLDADRAHFFETAQSWIDALELSSEAKLDPAAFEYSYDSSLPPWLAQRQLTAVGLPSIAPAVARVSHIQTELAQIRIACALERFRLAHGSFPQSLEELDPEWLPEVPSDLLSGRAFRYLRQSPDAFRLWAVGWDQHDDGGMAPSSRSSTADGDWVLTIPLE